MRGGGFAKIMSEQKILMEVMPISKDSINVNDVGCLAIAEVSQNLSKLVSRYVAYQECMLMED